MNRDGTRSRGRSFLGRWPALKLAFLWCGIVGALTWFGGAFDVESAILLGGLGVGMATCVAAGFGLLGLVHTRSVGKIEAIVWLAVSSLVSPILAVIVTETVANVMGVLRDESSLAMAETALWAVTIAGGTFFMFTPIVIGINKPPAQPREEGGENC